MIVLYQVYLLASVMLSHCQVLAMPSTLSSSQVMQDQTPERNEAAGRDRAFERRKLPEKLTKKDASNPCGIKV